MNIENIFTQQINAVVDERVARVRKAFGELKLALEGTLLTPDDFREAEASGVSTSTAQVVMDLALRRYLGPEVFEFVSGCAAAHQRDLAAKNGNGDTRN